MADLKLKGQLKFKGNVQQINDTFSKKEFWMEIDQDSEYPQTVKLTLIRDKCDLIDKYAVGDVIDVDVNVRGRVVKLKDGRDECFNELNVWRIAGMASQGGSASQKAEPAPAPEGDIEDLPF